jgi:hypothetical protein
VKRAPDEDQQRKADLVKMLSFYDQFVREEGMDLATRLQTASAHRRRGAILQRLGKAGEAETAYRQSAAVLEKLAAERPDAAAYQLELAATLLELGALLKAARRPDALAVSRRAQAALEAAARKPAAGAAAPKDVPPLNHEVLASYAAQVKVPLSSIVSGTALNDLLRNVQKAPPVPGRPPDFPFDEVVMRKINLSRLGGNARLLRAGGLKWPVALQGDDFRDYRLVLERVFREAARGVGRVAPDTLLSARSASRKIDIRLTANINELSPAHYIEGRRFLIQINEALTALGSRDAAKHFNGDYDPKGMTLGELVQHMTKNELLFAPALEGDEVAYLALHHAFMLYLETVKAP